MRIHANHSDYLKYSIYLDGEHVWFAWVADEEAGFVEVDQYHPDGRAVLADPAPRCAVSKRTGKIYPTGYQGTEEVRGKDGKESQQPIELLTVTAPWAQWALAPRVKKYGKVEVRRR